MRQKERSAFYARLRAAGFNTSFNESIFFNPYTRELAGMSRPEDPLFVGALAGHRHPFVLARHRGREYKRRDTSKLLFYTNDKNLDAIKGCAVLCGLRVVEEEFKKSLGLTMFVVELDE